MITLKDIALTYDHVRWTDGTGAQMQRVYGIFAIARMLGLSYIHSPLSRVDYQGLTALVNDSPSPSFHEVINDVLSLPSDPFASEHAVVLTSYNPKMEELDSLIARCLQDYSVPVIIKIVLPYAITDRFPDCYEVCKSVSPFIRSHNAGDAIRVALHVRRGELFIVDTERMLPNRYYISIAQRLIEMLNGLAMAHTIEVHTENVKDPVTVKPSYKGICGRIDKATVLTPSDAHLDDFAVLPSVEMHVNDPTVTCLAKLATADILVMSKSSYSYLAAILNPSAMVISPRFWHAPLSKWLIAGADAAFDYRRAVSTLTQKKWSMDQASSLFIDRETRSN